MSFTSIFSGALHVHLNFFIRLPIYKLLDHSMKELDGKKR